MLREGGADHAQRETDVARPRPAAEAPIEGEGVGAVRGQGGPAGGSPRRRSRASRPRHPPSQ